MSTIDDTEKLVEFLASVTNELTVPSTMRVRISVGCFGIALDHHHAVSILVKSGRLASAFALARMVFEAFLRGAWLANAATETEVQEFAEGKEPPKVDRLLAALESKVGYEDKFLSEVKASAWKAMCSYTHTGGLQVQRWQSASSIEPSYTAAEVGDVLIFVNSFAALSAIELTAFSVKENDIEKLVDRLRCFCP